MKSVDDVDQDVAVLTEQHSISETQGSFNDDSDDLFSFSQTLTPQRWATTTSLEQCVEKQKKARPDKGFDEQVEPIPGKSVDEETITVAIEPIPAPRCRWKRLITGIMVVALVASAATGSVLWTSKRRKTIVHLQSLDGTRRNANFGSAVALSRTGHRLAVASRGSVTVYEKNTQEETWFPMGEPIIVNPNPPLEEFIGRNDMIAIDLNADGDCLVLGYTREDNSTDRVGFVKIYHYVVDVWMSATDPAISDGSPGDRFGTSVSISASGETVAVGAPGTSNGKGRVYSYQLNPNGEWKLRDGFSIDGIEVGGELGCSVALSAMGDRLAVGGRSVVAGDSEKDNKNPVAQVYELGDFSWSMIGNRFVDKRRKFSTVWMVDLSADGNRCVISNSYTREEDFINAGSLVVQALEFDGTSWTRMGGNIHQDVTGPKSGYFVSLSDDGLTIVMGDPGAGSGANGHAHVYRFVNGEEWIQQGRNVDGESEGDMFGASVAIAGDGITFVAGAPLRSFAANDAGRVQTFAIL